MDYTSDIAPPTLAGRRKTLTVAARDLIRIAPLRSDGDLPVMLTPVDARVHLAEWCTAHRDLVDSHLQRHGALLFRGCGVAQVDDFEAALRALGGDLLEYAYRSTPRTHVGGRVYTSTEYPAEQSIPLHNENAYASTWPLKIAFFCVHPAEHGGETPIADSRRVHASIDPALRRRFLDRKVMYVRNYTNGVDLSWQTTFQTDRKDEVERFCRGAGIAYEWKRDGSLRTRNVCDAIRAHPVTSELVWFNQAHLFHASSLPPEVRDVLLAERGEADLPRHACYGDGSPIEPAALQEIRAAYREHTQRFAWQAGDVLLLDNMLCAHGRAPFQGRRRVVVAMAQACGVQAS